MRFNNYSKSPGWQWLGNSLINNTLPWHLSQTVPLSKFFSEYTLHDSLWGDFWMEPWAKSALAVFSWDTYWTNGRVSYSSSDHPFLIIAFMHIYQVTIGGRPEPYGFIANVTDATSQTIPESDRKNLFKQHSQSGISEQVLEAYKDSTLHITVIKDIFGGATTLLHSADTRLLCIKDGGQVVPIPGFE